VVALSSEGASLSPDGKLEIRFNQAIALYPRVAEATMLRELNDGFAIFSPDKDADGILNALVSAATLTPPVAPTYRGVSYSISGDRLTLKWDKAPQVLRTTDADDPIVSVSYGGLSAIVLYTGTVPSSEPVSLATLLGSNAVEVQLTAF